MQLGLIRSLIRQDIHLRILQIVKRHSIIKQGIHLHTLLTHSHHLRIRQDIRLYKTIMLRLPIKRGIRLRILLTQIEMQLEDIRLPMRMQLVEELHFHLQLIKVARLFKVKVHFQLMQ